MDRYINGQTGSQIDRQIDRQIGGQISRQIVNVDRQIYGQIHRQIDRQTDRHIESQIVKMDRFTNRQKGKQIGRQIHSLCKVNDVHIVYVVLNVQASFPLPNRSRTELTPKFLGRPTQNYLLCLVRILEIWKAMQQQGKHNRFCIICLESLEMHLRSLF